LAKGQSAPAGVDEGTMLQDSSLLSQSATMLGKPTTSNPQENNSTMQTQTTNQTSTSTIPSRTCSTLSLSTDAPASTKDDVLATVAAGEKNNKSAVADAAAEKDVLGVNFTASSIKRSFAKLSKMDLSVNRASYQTPYFHFGFCGAHGGGFFGPKEMPQEDKDCLVAFANKYIIRGRGERGAGSDNVKDDDASKTAARGKCDAGDDDVKDDCIEEGSTREKC
jgi:hypothetical protein